MRKRPAAVWAVVMAVAAVAFAQTPPDETPLTPMMEAAGEPEGDFFYFPPMRVDARVFQMNDPLLSRLAHKIEDGSANLIERRAWWWLEQRLAPFDEPVPADWLMKAQATIQAMERARSAESNPVPKATLTWVPIGSPAFTFNGKMNSGRATALWVDPSDQNVILLGTADGGVWKTTNQGSTWAPIFDSAASLSIGSLAVDPNNRQVLYVGTGEGSNGFDMIGGAGIYKSTNGGSSWTPLALPPFYYTPPWNAVLRIAVDPNNSDHVYAAIHGGLLYSTNAGASWTLTQCNGSAGAIGCDIVLDPNTNPTTIFAAFGASWGRTDNGIYRATSGAGPWTTIGSSAYGNGFPTANIGRITLLVAPSDPKQMYALIHNVSTNQSLGIFYTPDATTASVTWQAKSATNYCSTQCWFDMTGVVNPADPAGLIVGGLNNYLSKDNGTTLSLMSQWNNFASTRYSHADHHHMVMPSSTTLYDANDGGFFVGTVDWATPLNSTWVDTRNAGLPTLQFYGFAQHPTDATKVTGGLQDNGQAYFDGVTWSEVKGGDGGCSAWDQSDPNYAYEEYAYAGIARNSGMEGTPTAWTCIQNINGCSGCNGSCIPDGRTDFIAPFALDANNQNSMYAGTYYLYNNANPRAGNTWVATSATDLTYGGGSGTYITAIHSAKNNGTAGTIYVGTSNGKASCSSTGGASWTNVSAGLSGAWVTSFASDPANGQRVLATLSGYGAAHVYRSINGGAAWTNITGSLPAQPYNSIVLDPADANHAYAGSDFGVFESTNVWAATPAWGSNTSNLPAVSIQQLGYVSGGRLRAATHGRGVWELIVSALANPKEDSPSHNMTAAKASGTSVDVTFISGCGATENTVYTGNLATLQTGGITWTGRYCNRGTASPANFDPGASNIYFVVVGNNASGVEGSYGQTSTGAERPPAGAGAPCAYAQNLSGACP